MTSVPLRSLGRSDLYVSAVGLGCNNFGRPGAPTEDQKGTSRVVHAAIDHGLTFLDTAEMYGYGHGRSEDMMGRALTGRRDSVVLASKFGNAQAKNPELADVPHGSRRYIRTAIEGSLRRLRTDYLDLYQMHTPDPETPIDETLAALHELVDEGLVRFIGHSNFSADQLLEADRRAASAEHPRFISAQNEYSLLVRDAEAQLLPAADRVGVGILPYYPLFNGLLTGKFTRDGGPADTRIMRQRPELVDQAPWDALERLASFGAARAVGLLEVSIGWLLSRGAVGSVIAGATSTEQIAQNAVAATAWTPTADELAEVDAIIPPPLSRPGNEAP